MIEGRKLESYVKAAMIADPYTAISTYQIRKLIFHAFDDVESEEAINIQRIQRILKSWLRRGWVYRIAVYGRGGVKGSQSIWILSGEPFEVDE